eukprot:GEMP01070855.1.p1 GENE.GEMP01070855.1~~GEMP01070855.1.p1  ORF type:complete len:346 (+),score=90.16 GEMP01070855.1:108-1040(+)
MRWITKLLGVFPVLGIDDPCSCGGGFLEVRPWKTFIPGAAESSNPCGCNFEKLTSRDELLNLPVPELRKRLTTLTEKNKALEDALETEKKEHRKELEARTKQVEELWKEEHDTRVSAENADDARSVKLHEHASKVKNIEDKVAKLNDDLSNLRHEWSHVNDEVVVQLAGLAKCPRCTGEELALLRKEHVSLVRKHQSLDVEQPMELVLEIGRLEMKRNSLMKQQTEEQRSYGSEFRRLDKEKEKATQTLEHQQLSAKRYKQQDAKRTQLIKRQLEILEPVTKDREEAIARMRQSIKKMNEQLKLIKKCCQ